MLKQFHAAQWRNYAQPEWNTETTVAEALSSVCEVSDSTSSSAAYDKLLYAVGNNHAGTYYPVVLAIMPLLDELLCVGGPWSVRTVLEALIDLSGSFQPEPGYQVTKDLAGNPQELAHMFKESVRRLRPSLEHLAAGGQFNSESAKELLNGLDEDHVSPWTRR
jgi:hypothetical protein